MHDSITAQGRAIHRLFYAARRHRDAADTVPLACRCSRTVKSRRSAMTSSDRSTSLYRNLPNFTEMQLHENGLWPKNCWH
jgi:hypothetical protein